LTLKWVCVSDLFDIERMTKEIFKTFANPNFDLSLAAMDLQNGKGSSREAGGLIYRPSKGG
jgi:hypothetical protein